MDVGNGRIFGEPIPHFYRLMVTCRYQKSKHKCFTMKSTGSIGKKGEAALTSGVLFVFRYRGGVLECEGDVVKTV